MKLRRAMAVAAATAVISPVTLLAAPAAFATDGQQDGRTSETTPAPTASESETTAPEESAEPTAPEETEPAPTATDSAPAEETPGTEDPSDEPSDEPTDEPTESTEPSPSPSDDEGEDDDEGEEEDGYEICLDEDGNELADLGVSVSGLPGQVRAGSTQEFTLSAANSGKQTLEGVEWEASVMNDDDLELREGLFEKVELSFYDPESDSWVSLYDFGVVFGETTLAPGQTIDIKLRMTVAEDAPLGAGYAFGFTGYLNEEENCVTAAYAYYDFTVIGAGATPKPGDAKETEGKKPQGGYKPVEEKKTLEPTGQLAETGAGSMLPVLGLVGGVTVLAGAGVVFAVRRRGGVGTAA
ncbi:LPXTG cell wall anchor domain-containing protein [Streptomyces diastaticus]|uniref:LPXTG cell wall anchor domain-containing protein n=1 Tax=Streptomyces diastaticus TaxID=1956 RepID=UPI00381E9AEE